MTNEPSNSGAPRRADENDESPRRNNEPMVLALIGLGVAALLFVASALPVILSRGDDESGSDATFPQVTTEPTSSTGDPANSSSPVAPTTIPDASTPAEAPGSTEAPVSSDAPGSAEAPDSTDAPATTEAPPATGVTDDVPESVAVVLGGKIYLEGAVPNEAARDQIVELATEIFTSDNVIDNYVIDPRASDPNLGNIRVDDIVLFEPDSAGISPDFEPLLNQGLALLTIRPAATFVIEGHTDSLGSDNLRLSQERADAVVRWYTDRGIDASRLTAIGRGDTEPIASDETRAGRDRNRRIEVTIENLLVSS